MLKTVLGGTVRQGVELSCISRDRLSDRGHPQSQLLRVCVVGRPATCAGIAVPGTAGVQSPWDANQYFATRWALLINDEFSRHSFVSVRTGSVSLSCFLIREDAGTLMRAFGAQQGVRWQVCRMCTRKINCADARCFTPIGLIFLTEPHCSVSNQASQ